MSFKWLIELKELAKQWADPHSWEIWNKKFTVLSLSFSAFFYTGGLNHVWFIVFKYVYP
jgi:hypothetical protein